MWLFLGPDGTGDQHHTLLIPNLPMSTKCQKPLEKNGISELMLLMMTKHSTSCFSWDIFIWNSYYFCVKTPQHMALSVWSKVIWTNTKPINILLCLSVICTYFSRKHLELFSFSQSWKLRWESGAQTELFGFHLIAWGYSRWILRFPNLKVKVLLKCISPGVKFITLQLTVKFLRNRTFYSPATAVTEHIPRLLYST